MRIFLITWRFKTGLEGLGYPEKLSQLSDLDKAGKITGNFAQKR